MRGYFASWLSSPRHCCSASGALASGDEIDCQAGCIDEVNTLDFAARHGHTLQLNLTNSFGTTFGQLARGGSPHDIYLGFNVTRRF